MRYEPAKRSEMLLALFVAIFSVFATNVFLWSDAGLGASCCTAGLAVCAMVYLWRKRRRTSLYGCWCVLMYLVCAISLTFTDVQFMKFLVTCALFLLSSVAYLEFMDLRTRRDGSFRSIRDVFCMSFVMTFGSYGRAFYALFHREDAEGQPRKRGLGNVMLGLVIALPMLLIIIPLLMSSDAAFDGLIKSIGIDRFPEFFISIVLGLGVFLWVYSRLLALPREPVPAQEVPSNRGIEPSIVVSFLSVVSLVYLLYLFSQFSYFFSAFAGFLPEHYSVAEYARRGFFEMTVLCSINLGLVFLSNLISRKQNGKAALSIRLLSLFLCVFSLVLAATSISKIILYVQRFGMTHLRIYTSVFIVFLAVVLLSVMARLFCKKVPYMKIALAFGSLLLALSVFVNIDRVIAKYNVEAYLSGRLDSVDMETLEELDSNAKVPYLLELVKQADGAPAVEAKAQLRQLATQFYHTEDGHTVWDSPSDFRSWDICTAEAAQLLLEHRELYLH